MVGDGLSYWLGHRYGAGLQQPRVLGHGCRAAVSWGRCHRHARVRAWAEAFDPQIPRVPAFLLWGMVLIGALAGFLGVLEDVLTGDPLTRADAAINHLVQSLRTGWADAVMVVLTMLGDGVAVSCCTPGRRASWWTARRSWSQPSRTRSHNGRGNC